MPAISDIHYPPEAFAAWLASPEVQARLILVAEKQGLSAAEADALANQYARKIAAHFDYRVSMRFDAFLSGIWRRLFDRIEVRGVEAVKALPSDATLLYLPCHRSHLDYLLLSQTIHHSGLVPPHIAAGENLDLPVLGWIFRCGGGFFMRRSFKGDPYYAAVFAAYLESLLLRGLPIEIFFEGGRSRTGRMLTPKTGLLGMVLEAYVRNPQRPLVLVPVYIGYEKLPEGRSFLNELAGRPKRSESLWDLVASVRVLWQRFGSACISFGRPLMVADWLDEQGPGWRESNGAGLSRALVTAIAEEASRRIEAAALVSPMNLVALALLAFPGARANAGELMQRIAQLQEQAGEHLSIRLSASDCLAHALALGMVERQGETVAAPGDKAALLAYFRNNVVHHFPALDTDAKESTWKKSG